MSVIGAVGVIAVALAWVKLVSVWEKKEQEDRKKHPEKWAKIDAERWDIEAAKFYKKYCRTMYRIPRSRWILMNREEKSEIFEKRETLKGKYKNLPEEVKVRLKKDYKIDTSFRGA